MAAVAEINRGRLVTAPLPWIIGIAEAQAGRSSASETAGGLGP